jgi:hypothetical protein
MKKFEIGDRKDGREALLLACLSIFHMEIKNFGKIFLIILDNQYV